MFLSNFTELLGLLSGVIAIFETGFLVGKWRASVAWLGISLIDQEEKELYDTTQDKTITLEPGKHI